MEKEQRNSSVCSDWLLYPLQRTERHFVSHHWYKYARCKHLNTVQESSRSYSKGATKNREVWNPYSALKCVGGFNEYGCSLLRLRSLRKKLSKWQFIRLKEIYCTFSSVQQNKKETRKESEFSCNSPPLFVNGKKRLRNSFKLIKADIRSKKRILY